jgi:hypothetical protein
MERVTVDQVMSWYPCPGSGYTRERIESISQGRDSLTALEILDLDIPVEDRFWAVLRTDFLSEQQLRLVAADFAERVLHMFEAEHPADKRPLQIEAARAFARGVIFRQRLYAARAAAGDAARDAAFDAAGAAARDAEGAAAVAAAVAASGDAERAWQVNRVREYLRGEVE